MSKELSAWSKKWIEQLSWRKLQECIRIIRARESKSIIESQRLRRLESEFQHRKWQGMKDPSGLHAMTPTQPEPEGGTEK